MEKQLNSTDKNKQGSGNNIVQEFPSATKTKGMNSQSYIIIHIEINRNAPSYYSKGNHYSAKFPKMKYKVQGTKIEN